MLIPSLPLISVGKSWVVGPEKNRKNYALIGNFAFHEAGYFLYHLDSDGFLYSIQDVKRVPLAELTLEDRFTLLLYDLFNGKGRWGWAHYQYSEKRQLSLDEAKAFLVEQALRVNWRWKANGPLIREFEDRISSARTTLELINVSISLG